MALKKISLVLSLILLSTGLFGCQQSSKEEVPNNDISKSNEEISNKEIDEDYDIEGVVSRVSNENNRVLVALTKKVQENESQMWIEIVENTKIYNGNKEMISFEDLKREAELKANLADECLDSNPRICFAEKIVIE